MTEPYPISDGDLWVKVVEVFQQNRAAIEPDTTGGISVYFITDTGGVFDEMGFGSEANAIAGLTRNMFIGHRFHTYRQQKSQVDQWDATGRALKEMADRAPDARAFIDRALRLMGVQNVNPG